MVNGTLASAPDVKDVFKGYPAPGVGAGAGTPEVSVLVALGSIRHRRAPARARGASRTRRRAFQRGLLCGWDAAIPART